MWPLLEYRPSSDSSHELSCSDPVKRSTILIVTAQFVDWASRPNSLLWGEWTMTQPRFVVNWVDDDCTCVLCPLEWVFILGLAGSTAMWASGSETCRQAPSGTHETLHPAWGHVTGAINRRHLLGYLCILKSVYFHQKICCCSINSNILVWCPVDFFFTKIEVNWPALSLYT